MKTTITILATISILIVFIACECTDTKKQQKEPEQIRYHAERMKNAMPIDFSQHVRVDLVVWKITRRDLMKKDWRE